MTRHYKFRFIVTLFFSWFTFLLSAQTQVQGTIKDSETHQVLPFSNIGIKSTVNGTISNGDGVFTIMVDTTKDLLVISCLGHQTKTISAKQLIKNSIIYLQQSTVSLNEVTVKANNDFLYVILSDCRKKIQKDYTPHVSKTYFSLETKRNKYPVELLEGYYNAYQKGINVDKLLLKNGKIARDTVGAAYFSSLSTSKALSKLNLSDQNNYFPALPLQFSENKMKHYFKLQLMNSDEDYLEIAFKPIEDSSHYFTGKIWVDKSHNLLKIEMRGVDTKVYPFVPIFPCDTISDFSINITQTYAHKKEILTLEHINFTYNFAYKSVRDSLLSLFPYIDINSYEAEGLIYFYDYERPFILPYFDYDADMDDYRKIFLIPYNPIFWKNNNNTLLLTKEQKQSLDFFTKHGTVVNYDNNSFDYISHNVYTDSTYDNSVLIKTFTIFWSEKHRLSIMKNIPDSEELSKMEIGPKFIVDLYKLKVQILLDVTRVGDSLYHSSYTVFDQYQSYFYLEKKPYSNCFLNIYFDICEIERQKMEKQLPLVGYNLEEINRIYNQTKVDLDKISEKYFKEVQLGENEEALQKWSDYVNDHLGIDNIKMHSEQLKQEP